MKKFFMEFKTFALRGNVMDMAIGVIIGAAFKSIVDSLVNDVISPVIGLLFKTDFSNLAIKVPNTDVIIGYGSFITVVINFIIMAFVIFCFVKFLNALSGRVKQAEEPEKPKTKKCPYCLSDVPAEAGRCAFCTSDISAS